MGTSSIPGFSIETLPLLLAILVPGFVWARIHGFFQLARPATKETWFEIITLSAINYALWFWLVPFLIAGTRSAVAAGHGPSFGVTMGWVGVTLLSPCALGAVTGFAHRKSWFRNVLINRLHLNIPHPTDTAWDYVFGDAEVLWAVVTLTDGSVVEGLFAERSMASSKQEERDLYIEQYFERKGEELILAENSAGIWISPTMIKTVEFKRPKYAG